LRASQGDFSAAIESFKASLLIRDSLIAADPGNSQQRSYLGEIHRNMSVIQKKQSRFDAALASYDAALSIRRRLVAADPGNGAWQRDLIAMHNDIGDLHRSRSNATAALDSYRAGLAAAEHLAKADPGNAEWQRNLTVLANKVRDLLAAQGNPASSDLPAARATYKAPPATSKALKREAPVIDGVDGVDWVRVPDAVRRPVLPVGPPPDWVDGFRFARTSDGQNDDGSLRISPERGHVTGEAERDRLLAYLTGGAMVVDSLVRGPDLIDPTRQLAVPARFRTDGAWVWPGSVEYYLRWHNVAPEPELRARIEQSKYRCPPVETAVVTRARAAVNHRADLIQKKVEAYRAEHPEPRPGDPDRFDADVNARLLAIGWTRGRDISAELGDWLAPRVAELSKKFSEPNGLPPYAPFPAAVAVMREFGGLFSLANGPGQTSAQVPFVIYPAPRGELINFAPDVQQLSETIGSRAFQVGEIERGMAALVVDESGRVFLVGPYPLYAGANIDEALTRMLRGIRCEKLSEVGL
jgi:tetratricopeptide (TPR) repeat protein